LSGSPSAQTRPPCTIALRLRARTWSVGDLTRYLRELLEGDFRLQDLWILGEVSNVSRPASGHLYFTLKDADASLRCVMWRSDVQRQRYQPREGDTVEAHGRLSVYDAAGQYQLYADTLRPTGEGELFQAFLRLKEKLEGEGLFDPARKRPLPAWPGRIGAVACAPRSEMGMRRRPPIWWRVPSPPTAPIASGSRTSLTCAPGVGGCTWQSCWIRSAGA